MQYYKRRHIQDSHVRDVLQSKDFTLKQGWEVVGIGEELVPLLLEMRRDNKNLYMRYVANSILEAIRRIQAVHSLSKFLEDTTRYHMEDIQYLMSKFDRAYDILQPHRTRVLRDSERAVRNDPRFIDAQTPTAVVLLVIEAISNQIHRVVGRTFLQESLDNVSILRHYAGEVGACPVSKFSIIEKVASFFNIKCHISGTFLIIEDESFESGRSYVSLRSGTFKPSVYAINDVYRAVQRTNPRDPIKALRTLTEPWTLMTIVESILKFQEMDTIVRDATLREGMVDYQETYPISKIHIQTGIVEYFGFTYRIFLKRPFDLTRTPLLAQIFPFDAAFLNDNILEDQTLDLRSIAQESYLKLQKRPNTKIPKGGHTLFQLGQVVLHSTGVCSVIVGVYSITEHVDESDSDNEDMVFYRLLNGLDVSGQRLQLIRITECQLQSILDSYDIGIYFTHFDYERARFVPHEKLQVAYGLI
jgi:hypothetical protein